MRSESLPAAACPKPPGVLRIVSLNTWKCDGEYAQRLPLMADGLHALQPDFVVLQEAFRSMDGRWDTAGYLAAHLQMQATYSGARRKLRLVQGDWLDSESAMAILCKQTALAHFDIALPSNAQDGGRLAQLAAFGAPSQKLWLANVHLTHLSGAHALRQAQLAAVWAHPALAQIKGSVWILGDFNVPLSASSTLLQPPSPWLAEDAFAQVQAFPKFTHIDSEGCLHNLDHCIRLWQQPVVDFVVVSAHVVLNLADPVSGIFPSDHFGVCVDLSATNAALSANAKCQKN